MSEENVPNAAPVEPQPEEAAPQGDRLIRFLIAGEIEYIPQHRKERQYQRVNVLHVTAAAEINIRGLARIQTILQNQFLLKYQRMSKAGVEITDVIILSITPLGQFTEEEFNPTPPPAPVTPAQA